MSYVDKHLNAGESVVFRTSLHPCVYAGAIVVAVIGLFLIAGIPDLHSLDQDLGPVGRVLGVIVLVAAGVVAIATAIMIKTSEFAVTTSRVVLKVGWLSQRTIELQLSKVESIGVEQDFFGRMFDFGSIQLGGTGGTKEPFMFVRAPLDFRKQVQQQIDRLGQGAPITSSATAPRDERACPHCAELILAQATRCRFCGQPVQPTR